MAAVVARTMTLAAQNHVHMMPQNCVIVSSASIAQATASVMHHTTSGTRPIAPATDTNRSHTNANANSASGSGHNSKKRINFTHMPYTGQPASVARRNARERNRVRQVNNGFANLRQHIPQTIIQALTNGGRGASKKLSKVDTLRLAVEYIRRLKDVLDESDTDSSTSTSSVRNCNTSTGSYYAGSPTSGHHQHHSLPDCSESSASPTPSYSSDASSGHTVYPMTTTPHYQDENYDTCAPMSPEDEMLLDVISWWQQQ